MEFEKKQTLEPAYKRVSLTGVQEIHNYLRLELGRFTSPNFPLSWSWEWMSTVGEFRGKLPGRLAHMLKATYDIKLKPKQKSEIGNIARRHLLVKEAYTIDFTTHFDWDAGDFGDSGSCFWGANYGAREIMEEEGVIAIRFYDEDGRGSGRAWLYELSNDAWVLFNAYGLECPEVASIFAAKLKEDTGDTWEYEQMDHLQINGISRGFVYINNSPQIVYREGYDHELCVDLDWDIPYFLCADCEDWVHEDELYYDEDYDESLCESCYRKLEEEREEERLAKLEEILEKEMEEDFQDAAGRAEIVYTMAQEATRNSIRAQLVAGQLCLGIDFQMGLSLI